MFVSFHSLVDSLLLTFFAIFIQHSEFFFSFISCSKFSPHKPHTNIYIYINGHVFMPNTQKESLINCAPFNEIYHTIERKRPGGGQYLLKSSTKSVFGTINAGHFVAIVWPFLALIFDYHKKWCGIHCEGS